MSPHNGLVKAPPSRESNRLRASPFD